MLGPSPSLRALESVLEHKESPIPTLGPCPTIKGFPLHPDIFIASYLIYVGYTLMYFVKFEEPCIYFSI